MYLTNRNLSSNTLPDFHFLPNTQMIDELTKLNIKKNRLFVTGNPIWDNLYENSTKIINQKSETNKINLLIITDALFEHGVWTEKQRNNFLNSLLSVLKKNDNIDFSLKIHPTSENKEYYFNLLNNLQLKNKIYQNEDLWELIPNFDIALTYGFSTSHTELAALGMKTVFIQTEISHKVIPLLNEGINSGHIQNCMNLSSLISIIHSLYEQDTFLTTEFLKEREKFFYKFDGKSGYRVSQILLKNIK